MSRWTAIPQLRELRSASSATWASQRRLPVPLTPLVGREDVIGAVESLLVRSDVRLLTLTGPPGTGKTRVALAAASGATVAAAFDDGVSFVPLAPLRDARKVSAAMAAGLGLVLPPGEPADVAVQQHLEDRKLLLVLDNFEHLVRAAPALTQLLQRCPAVTLLVTSRARLHVYGEYAFPILPLSLPHSPGSRERVPLDVLQQSEAVRLFVTRAQAVQPTFALDEVNGPVVAAICRRLDGLPLAIELAAARVRVRPPRARLASLDRWLPLLTDGPRDVPPRQQSFHAAVAASYDLLSDAERRLFRRLGVFVGGCTLEAAAAVCAAPGAPDGRSLDELTVLADHSLIHFRAPAGELGVRSGEARVELLGVIREYALDRLAAAGEQRVTRQAHAAQYLALAEEADLHLRGPDQLSWLTRLDREHDNVRAALQWCAGGDEAGTAIEVSGDAAPGRGDLPPCQSDAADPRAADPGAAEAAAMAVALGLRLATAVSHYWYLRGHFAEGRRWLKRLLDRAAAAPGQQDTAYARALAAAGTLAWSQTDLDAARDLFERSHALARTLDDLPTVGATLHGLGQVWRSAGDIDRARRYYAESLAIRQELGDASGMAATLLQFGHLAARVGSHDDAVRQYGQSLALRKRIGDRDGIAACTTYLGLTAYLEGDYAAAQEHCERALRLWREIGDLRGRAEALRYLGMALHAQGQHATAHAHYRQSLHDRRSIGESMGVAQSLLSLAELALDVGDPQRAVAQLRKAVLRFWKLHDRHMVAVCLIVFAQLTTAQQDWRRAARLLGAADLLFGGTGSALWLSDRRRYEQAHHAAAAALDPADFAAAHAEGRTLTLDGALAVALGRMPRSVASGVLPASRDTEWPSRADQPSADGRRRRPLPDSPATVLSRQETAVAELIAHGLTNREIAARLRIAQRTAAWHVEHVIAKLGLRSRVQVGVWAATHDLLHPLDPPMAN